MPDDNIPDSQGVTKEGKVIDIWIRDDLAYYKNEIGELTRVEVGTTVQTKDGIWLRTYGRSERVIRHNKKEI